MYSYYMTQRPAMPGAMPRKGLENIEDMDPNEIIPTIGKGAYSVITYNRELTSEEISNYELTPCEIGGE